MFFWIQTTVYSYSNAIAHFMLKDKWQVSLLRRQQPNEGWNVKSQVIIKSLSKILIHTKVN